jgi:transcriptional regulator with XRE-family HTH domain
MTRKRGRQETFPEADNDTLRDLLRAFVRAKEAEPGWNQTRLGELLGVTQQTAGRYLRDGKFSYPAAARLAALLGAASVDELLSRGRAQDVATPWSGRDEAVSAARRFGYEARAIDCVVARFTDETYAHRPTRWWLDRIVHEATELVLAARVETPTPPPASVLAARTPDRSSGVERVAGPATARRR